MESQLRYNRITEGQVETTQPAQPTLIVASTSSPMRYKSYRSGVNVALGIIQIICGALLIGFSIPLITLYSPFGYISDGIWCGIIIILSGSFEIVAGKTKTKCWIVTSLVFSIFAAVFVIPVLTVGVLGIEDTGRAQRRYNWDLREWEKYRYSDDSYYYSRPYALDNLDVFFALNGLRVFLAVVQGIVAIIASMMACRPLCGNGTQTLSQVQYMAHQPGQVIMMTPQQMHQPAVAVPMAMQQGYTIPVLTPAGAPPMYSTIPAAPVDTQMATP